MDCLGFRKYVGAFADGELDVDRNLHVLEHLNMCPKCAAQVQEVHDLKRVLRHRYESVSAPQSLRNRVLASLDTASEVPFDQARSMESTPRAGSWMAFRRSSLIPLAMAAALLAAVLIWNSSPVGSTQPGSITVVSGRNIADARKQHRKCWTNKGLNHRGAGLGDEPGVIADRLSRMLDLDVIVPDYSDRGVELVGADACGIQRRPAAHVVYQILSTGAPLSVFTVGRLADLGSGTVGRVEGREFFLCTESEISVVAWHDGRQTYLICAELPQRLILDLAGSVRTAMATPQNGNKALLALTGAR